MIYSPGNDPSRSLFTSSLVSEMRGFQVSEHVILTCLHVLGCWLDLSPQSLPWELLHSKFDSGLTLILARPFSHLTQGRFPCRTHFETPPRNIL